MSDREASYRTFLGDLGVRPDRIETEVARFKRLESSTTTRSDTMTDTKDPSTQGADTSGNAVMFPVEPTQAQLDADRAANPDTSDQVSDKDNGGGG
jgi:hypothetical protein